MKQLEERVEEWKSKDQLLKAQREELVALRQEIVEHEKKAAGRRRAPDPRLVQNTESMFIKLVKTGQAEKISQKVWPHERVWKIHLVSCSVFGGSLKETYLTVMDSELGEDMLIFEAMHPVEEAELHF